VEGRIEDGDVRHAGQRLLGRGERFQAGRIVQRREFRQGGDLRADLGRDAHRGRERSAMHDAMTDGRKRRWIRKCDRRRLLHVVDESADGGGVAFPGDFDGMRSAILTGVSIIGRGPGPIGGPLGEGPAADRLHEGRLQAAGTGVQEEDDHAGAVSVKRKTTVRDSTW
jgi:hypothetical protein